MWEGQVWSRRAHQKGQDAQIQASPPPQPEGLGLRGDAPRPRPFTMCRGISNIHREVGAAFIVCRAPPAEEEVPVAHQRS